MTSRATVTTSRTLFQLVVLAFVGVVVWVGWGIYQAMVVSPKPNVEPQMLVSIPSEWDEAVVDAIVGHTQLAPQIDELIIQNEVPIIVASESAQVSP